jgi:hypothetical protein
MAGLALRPWSVPKVNSAQQMSGYAGVAEGDWRTGGGHYYAGQILRRSTPQQRDHLLSLGMIEASR